MSVFVVGSLHLDVIVDAPRLPGIDETLVGRSVAYRFGGKGGNQAVAAARMGATVAMAGAVGRDRFGDTLLAELDAAGVDRDQVQRLDGASGMSVAVVDDAGDYGAVIVSAANLEIEPGAIRVPAGARVLCLQNEVPEPVNIAAAQAARSAGARVMLNAAPARPLDERLLASVDLLVVNRVEAHALTECEDPHAAAQDLALRGPKEVIVTLGAEGVVAVTAGQRLRKLPAPRVNVASSHGAGDVFAGALAADLDGGAGLDAAMDFAQKAAALWVSTPPA